MKAVSRRDRIAAQLADLKMPGALEALADVLARVDGGAATAAEAIEELLAAQIALRNSRRLATAMRSSPSAVGQDARGVRLRVPAVGEAGAARPVVAHPPTSVGEVWTRRTTANPRKEDTA